MQWVYADPGRIVGLAKSNYIRRVGAHAGEREPAGSPSGSDRELPVVGVSRYLRRERVRKDDLGAHLLVTRGLRARSGEQLARLLDARERKPDRSYRCYGGKLPRVATHLIAAFPYGTTPEQAEAAMGGFVHDISDRLSIPIEAQIHLKNGQPDHFHALAGTRVVENGRLGRKQRRLDAVSEKRVGDAALAGDYLVGNTMEWMRSEWARRLRELCGDEAIDHRSYRRRGIAITPVSYVRRREIEEERQQGTAMWRERRKAELAARHPIGSARPPVAAAPGTSRKGVGLERQDDEHSANEPRAEVLLDAPMPSTEPRKGLARSEVGKPARYPDLDQEDAVPAGSPREEAQAAPPQRSHDGVSATPAVSATAEVNRTDVTTAGELAGLLGRDVPADAREARQARRPEPRSEPAKVRRRAAARFDVLTRPAASLRNGVEQSGMSNDLGHLLGIDLPAGSLRAPMHSQPASSASNHPQHVDIEAGATAPPVTGSPAGGNDGNTDDAAELLGRAGPGVLLGPAPCSPMMPQSGGAAEGRATGEPARRDVSPHGADRRAAFGISQAQDVAAARNHAASSARRPIVTSTPPLDQEHPDREPGATLPAGRRQRASALAPSAGETTATRPMGIETSLSFRLVDEGHALTGRYDRPRNDQAPIRPDVAGSGQADARSVVRSDASSQQRHVIPPAIDALPQSAGRGGAATQGQGQVHHDLQDAVAVYWTLRRAKRLSVSRVEELAAMIGLDRATFEAVAAEADAAAAEGVVVQTSGTASQPMIRLLQWNAEDNEVRRKRRATAREGGPAPEQPAPADSIKIRSRGDVKTDHPDPAVRATEEGQVGRPSAVGHGFVSDVQGQGSGRTQLAMAPAAEPATTSGGGAPQGSANQTSSLATASADALDQALVAAFAEDVRGLAQRRGKVPSFVAIVDGVAMRLRAVGRSRNEVDTILRCCTMPGQPDVDLQQAARAVNRAFSDEKTHWLRSRQPFVARVRGLAKRTEIGLFRDISRKAMAEFKLDLEAVWIERRMKADEAARRHARWLNLFYGVRWRLRRARRGDLAMAILAALLEQAVLRPLIDRQKDLAAAERQAINAAAQQASADLKARRQEWLQRLQAAGTAAASRRAAQPGRDASLRRRCTFRKEDSLSR